MEQKQPPRVVAQPINTTESPRAVLPEPQVVIQENDTLITTSTNPIAQRVVKTTARTQNVICATIFQAVYRPSSGH